MISSSSFKRNWLETPRGMYNVFFLDRNKSGQFYQNGKHFDRSVFSITMFVSNIFITHCFFRFGKSFHLNRLHYWKKSNNNKQCYNLAQWRGHRVPFKQQQQQQGKSSLVDENDRRNQTGTDNILQRCGTFSVQEIIHWGRLSSVDRLWFI